MTTTKTAATGGVYSNTPNTLEKASKRTSYSAYNDLLIPEEVAHSRKLSLNLKAKIENDENHAKNASLLNELVKLKEEIQ